MTAAAQVSLEFRVLSNGSYRTDGTNNEIADQVRNDGEALRAFKSVGALR